jgi:hypothetical protein
MGFRLFENHGIRKHREAKIYQIGLDVTCAVKRNIRPRSSFVLAAPVKQIKTIFETSIHCGSPNYNAHFKEVPIFLYSI